MQLATLYGALSLGEKGALGMGNYAPLFPHFERFVAESGLDRAKGSFAAKLPRILGKGTTRATGMDEPPADIERKLELAGLELPSAPVVPDAVRTEVHAAGRDVEVLRQELKREEGRRRFLVDCLRELADPKGASNGYYYADRLILREAKSGFEWAWCVTPHYPIVARIPPDASYVIRAFDAARRKIRNLALPADEFARRLSLAWSMAHHWSRSPDVLVTAVMKMYQVAGQDERFWQAPKRASYKDLPDAAFVVNLISWRAQSRASSAGFTFVPATLSQASGRGAKVFYLPVNAEGTEVRPMVYLRKAPGISRS